MESELNIWQKGLRLLQQIRERENTSSPDEIIPENTQKINLPVRDYIQHNRFQAEDIEDIKSRRRAEEAQRRAEEDKKNEGYKVAGEKFMADNAKKAGVKTTASGLQYQIIKEGEGEHPKEDSKVKVHYHGTT
ncbi:MAG: hypothetical protein RLZZ148_3023, partial [Cyanobacteriota bacterium]